MISFTLLSNTKMYMFKYNLYIMYSIVWYVIINMNILHIVYMLLTIPYLAIWILSGSEWLFYEISWVFIFIAGNYFGHYRAIFQAFR